MVPLLRNKNHTSKKVVRKKMTLTQGSLCHPVPLPALVGGLEDSLGAFAVADV